MSKEHMSNASLGRAMRLRLALLAYVLLGVFLAISLSSFWAWLFG